MLPYLLLPFPAHLADLLDLLVLLSLSFFEPFGVQLGALDGANEIVGMALGVLLGSAEGLGEQSRRGKNRPSTYTEKSDVVNRVRMS